MGFMDFLILATVALAVFYALKHIKKGGCGSCGGNCRNCRRKNG